MTPDIAASSPHPQPLLRSQGIATLTRLLQAGWSVEPPVIVRMAWSAQRADKYAYHFIVLRGTQRSLVVLDNSLELQQFLATHCIAVV
jgi:hypothetical protein